MSGDVVSRPVTFKRATRFARASNGVVRGPRQDVLHRMQAAADRARRERTDLALDAMGDDE